eukprot:TRINITY_DN28372_c0_g1_i1.p1 TRINITY_DN28372_c0_g1~~TRINITY_DN28372_c0_g1_i1.p1  ORF type:complete len:252 (-),score=31.99 TRINITY_DN28372_c0_g1_i1:329-1084(-)
MSSSMETRKLVTSESLSRMFDHCELNHAVHPEIAEFWNTVTCLAFVVVGIHGLVTTRKQHMETRYSVLNWFVICCGITGVLAHTTLNGLLIKLDHIIFTLTMTLYLWLIDGDDYLLIFWQIHTLFALYATAAFHWFFPIHVNIVTIVTFGLLFRKLQLYPDAPDAMKVLNLVVVLALAGSTLLASDHLVCGTELALPHMHALGQVLVASAFQYAIVLHAYMRAVQLKQPCEVAFHYQIFPYINPLTKAHNA